MKGIARALALTTAERYFSLGASFATLAIVSRLLSPGEIGVSVLGNAIVMLALSVREFATTNFIIQRKDLTAEDVRAAFTLLLIVTLTISVSITVSAGSLATAYGEAKLAPYLRVIALSILVDLVGLLIAALLRREMLFDKVALINVLGTMVGVGLTVALAVLGFSYMSFAWGWLAQGITVASLSLVFWRNWSIFKPCLRAWRGMVTFGGYNGTNELLFRLYDSLPYLLLGRILSLDAVALYNRSMTICQLPDKVFLGGVGSVLLSAFSAKVRGEQMLHAYYLRAVEYITAVQWPALAVLAILAHPIVHLAFGNQWLGVVPVVRIMALASLFSFSEELNFPVLVAVGAMRDVLIRSVIVWPVCALIVSCAALLGLEALALAWFVTVPFRAYVSVQLVRRHVAIAWCDLALILRKATILALCSAAGPLAVILLTGGRFELFLGETVVAIAVSAIGWGIGLWLTAHPLLQDIERAWTVLAPASLRAAHATCGQNELAKEG